MVFKKRVYADAAAATPLSPRAKAELVRLLDLYGNAGALHKEAVAAKEEIERARASVAASVGAHADEIVFTAGGTEANNLALEGLLRPLLREKGEVHAITSAIEHPSILEPLRALEREGLYTTVLDVDKEGFVDPEALRGAVNEETALVSIQLVNSEVGTIEPIRDIAKEIRLARKQRESNISGYADFSAEKSAEALAPVALATPSNIIFPLFHVDASQAPLWLDIKVDKLGVDLMTLDAQKILGPKGVGALYVRRGISLEPILWGGSQEGGLRAGTQNTPLIGSFAVALEDAQRGVEQRAQKVSHVRDYCFSEIKKEIPDVILNGPELSFRKFNLRGQVKLADSRVANNLNISIPGLEAQMAVLALDAEGIAASTRSACSAGDEEPSHVIQALAAASEASAKEARTFAGTAIRITFLPDITKRDAKRVAKTLRGIAQRYGKVL